MGGVGRAYQQRVSTSSGSPGVSTGSGELSPIEWKEIEPFDAIELPDFPVNLLPPVLRDWVNAEANSTQTPPDLAAMLSLAVCSFALSHRVIVSPYAGFEEPVNLYVTVVLGPGNRKSAVYRDAVQPITEAQKDARSEERADLARAKSARSQKLERLRKLEKTAVDKYDTSAGS